MQVDTALLTIDALATGRTWREPRFAAALARDLIRWAIPPTEWSEATTDGSGPYRDGLRISLDTPTVTDARFEVENFILILSAWIAHADPVEMIPHDFAFGSAPKHRLYEYTLGMRQRVNAACEAVILELAYKFVVTEGRRIQVPLVIPPDSLALQWRWRAVSQAVQRTCEFLFKIATSSTIMSPPMAGAVLSGSVQVFLQLGRGNDEIAAMMFHWRMRDALGDDKIDPEIENNLRPAFEAAWLAGEHAFAYDLLRVIDDK